MSTTTKNLGRVSIVPKGEWSSNSTYTRLDLVTYNGSSYIAKKDVPVNINLNNNEYWMTIALKGGLGDPLVFVAVYNETTYEEIEAALSAGKMVVAYNNGFTGNYCELATKTWGDYGFGVNEEYEFTNFNIDIDDKKYLYVMKCSKSSIGTTTWSSENYPIEFTEAQAKNYTDTAIANLNLQNLSQLEYEVIT